MRGRLRFALLLALALGCGIDVLGTGPDDAGSPSVDATADGSPQATDGSVDDAGPTDATSDGTSDGTTDATTDGATSDFLQITTSTAPTTLDVTAEGTIDWAHWGYLQTAVPIHHATAGSIIGGYTVTGAGLVGSNVGSGWPVFARWSNGDSSRPNEVGTNSFRYFTNSPNTAIAWSVPAATTRRTFTLYIAIGQAKARVTAKFSGTNPNGHQRPGHGTDGEQVPPRCHRIFLAHARREGRGSPGDGHASQHVEPQRDVFRVGDTALTRSSSEVAALL